MKPTGNTIEGRELRSAHTFHIPVLGTGFTIDTPLRVARYGIGSVISLADDVLIEQMRKHHCEKSGEPYEAITDREEDARARRITAYLNLLARLIRRQVEALRASPFEAGSEITRYFELLPETALKEAYWEMLASRDPGEKTRMQDELRRLAVPGDVDVNIMAKLDRDVYRNGKKLPEEFRTAFAALRGFARSSLRSSVVFSAGMNPPLYTYAARFGDFFPDADGALPKRIVLKVSDYRSAVIQGKFLAKRGLWISEYRIESGLNCGGHAFATKGLLLGPILEEFKERKAELSGQLHALYARALAAAGRGRVDEPHPVRITVQGGIGTAEEDAFLLDHYEVDATGWATPFLLVPEATNVDDETLAKLAAATERDVYLSDSSPFGIPFWNLRNSASEDDRRGRIEEGKPGALCTKGYLRLNTEFGEIPICAASQTYQERRLEQIPEEALSPKQLAVVWEQVLVKSCICRDLAGGATLKHGIEPGATPAVCPGPNIVGFSKISSLEEMVGHIYGRISLLTNPARPHMFIGEIKLYVDHARKELERFSLGLLSSTPAYFREFKENLLAGIEYYRGLAEQLAGDARNRFLEELDALCEAIEPHLACDSGANVSLDALLRSAESL
ncbi:MAG: hypothetical protein ABIP48_26700 [Planctomycetota bacterium]